MRRLVLIAAWVGLAACGSHESNALTRSSPSSSGPTGGASFQGTGGAPVLGAGGVVAASGGASTSYAGAPWGAGGVVLTGGFGGAAGFTVGSGGSLPDSGLQTATGGTGDGSGGAVAGTGGDPNTAPNPFPAGGLISQACSDCAATHCRDQEAACGADPACATIGTCISTCFGPTCLTCLTTLAPGYAKFIEVTNCTDIHCQPACPYFNAGGGTSP